jgi:hypothetical protein
VLLLQTLWREEHLIAESRRQGGGKGIDGLLINKFDH